MDLHMQQRTDATGAGRAQRLHSPGGSTRYFSAWNDVTAGRHLDIVTSNWKLDPVNSMRRTILPNFIPIRFDTTERYRLFWRASPTRTTRRKWVAIWDQFLIQKHTFITEYHVSWCAWQNNVIIKSCRRRQIIVTRQHIFCRQCGRAISRQRPCEQQG